MEDYGEYSNRAKLMTSIYAMRQNDENKKVDSFGGAGSSIGCYYLGKRNDPFSGSKDTQDQNNNEKILADSNNKSKESNLEKIILKDRIDDNLRINDNKNQKRLPSDLCLKSSLTNYSNSSNNKKKWMKRI